SPRYKFYLIYPNKTVILWQDWTAPGTPTATLTLGTTSVSATGTYTVRLFANESGDSLTALEAKTSLSFVLVPGCVNATLGVSTSPLLHAGTGATPTFTAT